MTFKKAIILGICWTCSTGAMAHQGVTNPAVKARMDAMVKINTAMKTIQHMAKGATPFNQVTATNAIKAIATLSAQTPDLFRERQDDPMTEALPAIWENFDDFVERSADMEQAARQAADHVTDIGSLQSALRTIGVTCKACHDSYRK